MRSLYPLPLEKKKADLFYLLFLTALSLWCFVWTFCRYGEQGLLFVAVLGLPISVASLAAENRFWAPRL